MAEDLRGGGKPLLWILLLIYVPFLQRYGFGLASSHHMDFPSYYWAARIAFASGESPYGAALLSRNILPFLYPPTNLLTLFPFSLFSYETAKLLLLVTSHLCIPAIAYLSIRILRPSLQPSIQVLFLAVYVLLFSPLAVTLELGQFNLLTLLFLCLFWYALRVSRSDALAALCLTVAFLLKVHPLFLLLLLFIKRRFRLVSWVLALVAVSVGVSLVWLPDTLWTEWLSWYLPSGGYGRTPYGLFSPAAPWNQSLNGFTSRLFLENQFTSPLWSSRTAARVVPYVLASGVVLVTAGISYVATRRRGDELIDLELGLFLLAMCLIAPLTWEHHLTLGLPAILIAVVHMVFASERRGTRLVVVLSALLIAWRLPFEAEVLRRGIPTLLISLRFYAVAALWVAIAVELWRLAVRAGDGPGGVRQP